MAGAYLFGFPVIFLVQLVELFYFLVGNLNFGQVIPRHKPYIEDVALVSKSVVFTMFLKIVPYRLLIHLHLVLEILRIYLQVCQIYPVPGMMEKGEYF